MLLAVLGPDPRLGELLYALSHQVDKLLHINRQLRGGGGPQVSVQAEIVTALCSWLKVWPESVLNKTKDFMSRDPSFNEPKVSESLRIYKFLALDIKDFSL